MMMVEVRCANGRCVVNAPGMGEHDGFFALEEDEFALRKDGGAVLEKTVEGIERTEGVKVDIFGEFLFLEVRVQRAAFDVDNIAACVADGKDDAVGSGVVADVKKPQRFYGDALVDPRTQLVEAKFVSIHAVFRKRGVLWLRSFLPERL